MNRRISILNELEALAPTLANAPAALLYEAPTEYFQNLSDTILSRINSDDSAQDGEISTFLNTMPKQNPYTLPQGYFENISTITADKLKKLEFEEQEVVQIIGKFSKVNTYKVSTEYFINFPNRFFDKIVQLESGFETLESIKKLVTYHVPIGYFEQLSNKLVSKLTNINVDTSLNFPKTMPYQVPFGYFENMAKKVLSLTVDVPVGYFDALSSVVLEKIKTIDAEKQSLNAVPLNPIFGKQISQVTVGHFGRLNENVQSGDGAKIKTFNRKNHWFRNVIAACFIGTVGFTAYKLIDQPKQKNEDVAKYVQPKELFANFDIDEALSKLDDTTIAKYLDNETLTENTSTDFEIQDDNFDQVLQQVPEADLQKHLIETGELTKQKTK